MQKLFLVILSTLFVFSLSSAAFAGGSCPDERDQDLTAVLSKEIYGLVKCEYPSAKDVADWLQKNPGVIIDWKEFLPSATFFQDKEKVYCFSPMVLHYHLEK